MVGGGMCLPLVCFVPMEGVPIRSPQVYNVQVVGEQRRPPLVGLLRPSLVNIPAVVLTRSIQGRR